MGERGRGGLIVSSFHQAPHLGPLCGALGFNAPPQRLMSLEAVSVSHSLQCRLLGFRCSVPVRRWFIHAGCPVWCRVRLGSLGPPTKWEVRSVHSGLKPRGAACSNLDTQPCATTFGGLEGGVGGSAGQPPGSRGGGGRWVPQHTYLKMIRMMR